MNYKEFFKSYCAAFNWVNNGERKVYCNPYCPYFMGLSKGKSKPYSLCEYDEIKEYKKLEIS